MFIIYSWCVALPPAVVISPALTNTKKGGHVEFNCLATGVGAIQFEYQWFFNQLLISGQNTSTLIIDSVTDTNSGNYTCSVINAYEGIGHSGVARLVILGMYYNYVAMYIIRQWDSENALIFERYLGVLFCEDTCL